MSLSELMLVVGLWSIWMGALLATLHRLGRDNGPARPFPLSAPSASGRGPRPS
jgi:hypothetical protein